MHARDEFLRPRVHLLFIRIALVVIPDQVQEPMSEKERHFARKRRTALRRLRARRIERNHDIAQEAKLAGL